MSLVTLTQSAQRHFNNILSGQTDKSILLSVKKAGCSGKSYVIDLIDNQKITNDYTMCVFDSNKLVIPTNVVSDLEGITIDYVTEGLNGHIVFKNPNAKHSCGCGESFTTDD